MTARTSFPLSRPVTIDGATYALLSMRRAKLRDVRACHYGTELESGYRLIARLAGVPVAVILALAPIDLGLASAAAHARLDKLAPRGGNIIGATHAG